MLTSDVRGRKFQRRGAKVLRSLRKIGRDQIQRLEKKYSNKNNQNQRLIFLVKQYWKAVDTALAPKIQIPFFRNRDDEYILYLARNSLEIVCKIVETQKLNDAEQVVISKKEILSVLKMLYEMDDTQKQYYSNEYQKYSQGSFPPINVVKKGQLKTTNFANVLQSEKSLERLVLIYENLSNFAHPQWAYHTILKSVSNHSKWAKLYLVIFSFAAVRFTEKILDGEKESIIEEKIKKYFAEFK